MLEFLLPSYNYFMLATQNHTQQRFPREDAHIFSLIAYRRQAESWVKLPRHSIKDHFRSQCSQGITKVKVKGAKGCDNTYEVKVDCHDRSLLYSMTQELQLQWFIHVINDKIPQLTDVNTEEDDYAYPCTGYLYKKSNFLGEWELCFVKIGRDGLRVAKDETSKGELLLDGIRQLWTRFQLIQHQQLIVFKLKNYLKYQFAIPTNLASKWTKAFYSLIRFE